VRLVLLLFALVLVACSNVDSCPDEGRSTASAPGLYRPPVDGPFPGPTPGPDSDQPGENDEPPCDGVTRPCIGPGIPTTRHEEADACASGVPRFYVFICYCVVEIEGFTYRDCHAGALITTNSSSDAAAYFDHWFDEEPEGPTMKARAKGKTARRIGVTFCYRSR
jgi:hypothetical protein